MNIVWDYIHETTKEYVNYPTNCKNGYSVEPYSLILHVIQNVAHALYTITPDNRRYFALTAYNMENYKMYMYWQNGLFSCLLQVKYHKQNFEEKWRLYAC